jgi:Uma2 family endonuclease
MNTPAVLDQGTIDVATVAEPLGAEEAFYEIINGERLEIPPMSAYAGKVASRLVRKLGDFAEAQQLGEAVVETLFRLPLAEDQGRNRRPDVAFVSFDRWPADRPQPVDANAWDVVPDLAVEVVSPHDLAEDLLDKILEYFRAGVRLVWMIWPRQRQVYAYETPTRIRVLAEADALEGEPVLPGFRLPLASLFDPVAPPAAT